jgi:hypothetical protein
MAKSPNRSNPRAHHVPTRPLIPVGHSYGGVVITEPGTDPKVAGLVYITAFAADKGESVNSLVEQAARGIK